MAKKKTQTKGRSKKVVQRQPSPFWQYTGAIFLIVLALFIFAWWPAQWRQITIDAV